MHPLKAITIIGFISCLSACENAATVTEEIPVVTGVSLQLAKHRKQQITDIHYDLSLEIANAEDSINATENISFQLVDNNASVQLDFNGDKGLLKSLELNGKSTNIVAENEHIVLPKESLRKGKNELTIRFICGDEALNRKPEFLYSLFVPARARSFMPCFDQPDLKAVFSLEATVPEDWAVITNGSLKSEVVNNGRKTCHFNQSDKISTYLFSLVAGKFKRLTKTINQRDFNLYYRETDVNKLNESLDTIIGLHAASLAFMETYTDIPYPFEKFDIIAIPDFTYGGMEHVGAIDYRASVLFLDKTATESEKSSRIGTIGHETAHMWFGNLVTMEWFNDVWMKEVFANFMADKISATMSPDTEANLHFLLEHHPSAYNVDRTEGAHPIRQELDNLDQAGSLYGDIIYQKAPIVIRQLEKTCGEVKFRQGLRKYLKRYSFGNAGWSGLIAILDEISTENLDEWNRQWITGPGMPILDYSLKTEKGIIKRFTISQRNHPDKPWKQHFSIALVYKDTVCEIPLYMDASNLTVKKVKGMKAPLFVVFNSTGEGYGAFPANRAMLRQLSGLEPVLRASVYLNAYERMLNGDDIRPKELLLQYADNVAQEENELILNRMSRQFRNTYWQFLSADVRKQISPALEQSLFAEIGKAQSPGKKRILFLLYTSISTSQEAYDRLYTSWSTQKNSLGLVLSDEDYITLASELALRNKQTANDLLSAQGKRIQDPDRKRRFDFVKTALSPDQVTRDRFFKSLSSLKNRENEVWVSEALGYLHHPLRNGASEKYLPATLELLTEIQRTGDIFFPGDWLRSSFGYYQSKKAAQIVRSFLKERPDYNKSLRLKILQESDDLFRAVKLVK